MDRSYPVLANASLDCRYFCSANCRRSSRFSASNCSTYIGLSSYTSSCPPRSSFPLTKTSSLRQRCPSARPTHWVHGTVLEHRILRLVPKDQMSGLTLVRGMAARHSHCIQLVGARWVRRIAFASLEFVPRWRDVKPVAEVEGLILWKQALEGRWKRRISAKHHPDASLTTFICPICYRPNH